ncbi:Memo-like protein [uncultured archaeon]|nr:Memo-like protein [uncultured archaeon]
MNSRKPVVAGAFYPAQRKALEEQIDYMFSKVDVSASRNAVAFVCPHAGYKYSGKTAACSYSRLREIGKGAVFIIIGPNHHGVGPEVSVYPEGVWETPLGGARIDADLAQMVFDSEIVKDGSAHLYEHSIEVQVPFLQRMFGPDVSFVPVCMLNQSAAVAKEVGKRVAAAIKKSKKRAIIIASSDFSHYVPKAEAERKDRMAIDAIESLDEAKLYQTVAKNQISMCGYGPVAATMVAAKALGAKRGKLLGYATSAETTGDEDEVVGYAAIEFTK